MLPNGEPGQLPVDPEDLRRGWSRDLGSHWELGTTQLRKNLPFLGVAKRKVTKMPKFLFKISLLLK